MPASLQYLVGLVLVASVIANDYSFTPFKRDLPSDADAKALPNAQYSISLTKKVSRPSRRTTLAQLIGNATAFNRPSKSASLSGLDDVSGYAASVTIGGQDFNLIVDTGSSDVWVPIKGFQCINGTSGAVAPQSACGFGTAGFDPSKSSTFVPVPDENFSITYGSGALIGTVAEETVSVGGLTVEKQIIGIGTELEFEAGDADGILGLSFTSLTSVFNGTNPQNDSSTTNHIPYPPFFFHALAEGAISEPFFSLALDRGSIAAQINSTVDPNLGYIAFGGMANVPVTDVSTTVPVQGFIAAGTNTTEDFYYTIDIEGYNFPGAPAISGSSATAIVDSGTTMAFLPTNIVQAYYDAMDPPATLSDSGELAGLYIMDCDAKAPPFSITIGGKNFSISAKDIFTPSGITANGTDLCISGIQPFPTPVVIPLDNQTLFVLGDVFMHNVVVTFNVEAPSLTITQRKDY